MGNAPKAEIALSIFLIVLCGAFLWESLGIPPGSFEPLGSAPIPQAVATIVMLLSGLVLSKAVAALRREGGGPDEGLPEGARPVDALLFAVLTVAYVGALHFRLAGFAIATAAFLFLIVGALERFVPRRLPAAAVLALVVGFGCEYLFTQVFVVDLPATG